MKSLLKNQIFVNQIFTAANLSRVCSAYGQVDRRLPRVPSGCRLATDIRVVFIIYISNFSFFLLFLDLSIADAGSPFGARPARLWISRGIG